MKKKNPTTPVTYYGGKQGMVKHILPLIPNHHIYVEPFFGGGAIFFAKEPAVVEIINDRNNEVVNFYRVTKERYRELNRLIQVTLHSRDQHHKARVIYDNPDLFDDVRRAWAFWVQSNNSFSSRIKGGWAYENKTDGTSKRLQRKKESFTDYYAKRLERVQVECTDALKVIARADAPDAFFYCDPPYFNSDMGHYKGYTQADFEALLQALSKVKGKFLLSSYPSDILSKYAEEHGWYQQSFHKQVRISSKVKKAKVEVLTANFRLE